MSGVLARGSPYVQSMTNRTSERWHSNPFVAVFDRIGPRRAPVLTGAVFLVTAAALVAQLAVPGLLEHVRRDGAAIDAGQWWRLLTGMFFQDGGLVGGVFNLVVLAIF